MSEPKDPIELVDGGSRFDYKTGENTPARVPMTYRQALFIGVIIAWSLVMAIFLGSIFVMMMQRK